ncbi:MAG: hypothetical protein R3290_05425 [Acidimicrobiia bacterium]|nr:hypothetical protein [Acidimicrobiia bacterium]
MTAEEIETVIERVAAGAAAAALALGASGSRVTVGEFEVDVAVGGRPGEPTLEATVLVRLDCSAAVRPVRQAS